MRRVAIQLYADASIRPDATGLGVIVRDASGRVIGLHRKRMAAMTCNEAEYEAVIFALTEVARYRPAHVALFSDSRVVVEQLSGAIAVRNDSLRRLHQRALGLARRLRSISYTHIPRERNRLADALANEALAVADQEERDVHRGEL